MKRLTWVIVTALIALPGAAFAQGSGVDFNLSNSAIRAAYDAALTLSGLDFSLEGLHNSYDGSLASVGLGLRANANPGASPVTALIGAKALWVDPDYPGVSSGTAVALGGGLNFSLPSYNRIAFGGYLYWAPKVTSFGNAQRFLEEEARAGYRLLPNGTLYIGYRHVTATFKNTDSLVIDNGINIGMALRF